MAGVDLGYDSDGLRSGGREALGAAGALLGRVIKGVRALDAGGGTTSLFRTDVQRRGPVRGAAPGPGWRP